MEEVKKRRNFKLAKRGFVVFYSVLDNFLSYFLFGTSRLNQFLTIFVRRSSVREEST